MKSKIFIGILPMVLLVGILTGCGHEHTWSDATCDAPKTCTECGQTDGEALGHDFADATCDKPSTCTRCGKTDGEALGHDFADATCAAPATCARCGKTEGEALNHTWMVATVDAPMTCEVCGATEGDKVSVDIYQTLASNDDYCEIIDEERYLKATYGDSDIDARIYDFDGNEISKINVNWRNYSSFSTAGGYVFYFDGTSSSFTLDAFDRDGEQQFFGVEFSKYDDVDIPNWKTDWPDAKLLYGLTVAICNTMDNAVHAEFYLDDNQMWFEDGSYTAFPKPEFDTADYEYITYCPEIDGYYVKRTSDSAQGYVDKNGKELCVDYMDATSFNKFGFALVSNDRKKYSIIDKDFNIIGKDVIEGNSASCSSDGFFSIKSDGNVKAVFINPGNFYSEPSTTEDEEPMEFASLKELVNSPAVKDTVQSLSTDTMTYDVDAEDDTIIFMYTFVNQVEIDDSTIQMLDEGIAEAAAGDAKTIADLGADYGLEANKIRVIIYNADGSEIYNSTFDLN